MNSIQDIWNGIMEILARDLTGTSLRTWFDDCELVDISEGTMFIHAGNPIKRKVLQENFTTKIKAALQEMISCDFDLRFLTSEERDEYINEKDNKAAAERTLPELDGYTFDEFIVGKCNEYAYAAAQYVVKNPGSKVVNPLFIYGNSGLGKTHLLRAIGTAVLEKMPKAKVVFTKSEDFTNQMVRSIKEGTTQEFRDKFRTVDLLLMDDIQFIAGKEATQEEFFCTFDSIYDAGHQIVIASDRPPVDMPRLDERLRTRFEGGLMADVQPPDLDTRIAIIRDKAGRRGMVLSDEIIDRIAQQVTANVRQIEGVINRLTAFRDITGNEICMEIVDRVIGDIVRTGPYVPTPDEILQEVAQYYLVSVDDIKGPSRQKNIATARHISAYLIRILTALPEIEVGKHIKRDRSTAHASVQRIAKEIKSDKKLANTVLDITSNINAKHESR